MSASLIAPKDTNRSSLLSSWAPVVSGGTTSRKGESSFNASLRATPGGARAQLETSQSGMEKSFKQRKNLDTRKKDVQDITTKHPHKVPIVMERSASEKSLPLLDKIKFLVPEDLTMFQLTTIMRKRLQLKDSQAFYLLINNRMIGNSSQLLADVYKTQKDEDGFLYITYASQEMFG